MFAHYPCGCGGVILAVVMLQSLVWPRATAVAEVRPSALFKQSEVDPRKATAVALNYCRAAFHRIRRSKCKRALLEEQERILNNLDLNGVADEDVIRLYSLLLDEIGQIEIAERERELIREQTRRTQHRQLGKDVFVIGAEVLTGQFGPAVRSGANSWWDFRNSKMRRDTDLWRVERDQMRALVTRSSDFLDSFWKLSRRNRIPDQWLVRDDDLDKLDEALAERDLEVRLRVLNRMWKFMECYPPYSYYLARTQQQLGLLEDAADTFANLARLGGGHFRKDEMLAASMANLAVIQDHLGNPEAPRTAMEALDFATRVWEANVMCAWVLGRHGEYDTAEDALLRNIDVDLETHQTSVALVSLYFHSSNEAKLAELLQRQDVVSLVPIPGLLLCAGLLGEQGTPRTAQRHLVATLHGEIDVRAGNDSLFLLGTSAWKLKDARLTVRYGTQTLAPTDLNTESDRIIARFADVNVAGHPLRVGRIEESITLDVTYPDTPPIRVHLQRKTGTEGTRTTFPLTRPLTGITTSVTYGVSSVEVGDKRLSLRLAHERVPNGST